MELFDAPDAMRAWSLGERRGGARVGVVPTMGALHDGHVALVDAIRRCTDRTVVTIFVNELQFNEPSDFSAYPRPLATDLATCEQMGVEAEYAPPGATMYPQGFQTHVEPGDLAAGLEGPMRPGHFRGVTTVVAKLFGATVPHAAAFGRKDYQQLAIVRRMVADLDMGIEIVGVPIAREPDGLAISSRNVRLTPADRVAATVLSRALFSARDAYASGERSVAGLRAVATATIASEERARIEYAEIVDAESLQPVSELDRAVVLLTAAWFGDVRLIDNVELG